MLCPIEHFVVSSFTIQMAPTRRRHVTAGAAINTSTAPGAFSAQHLFRPANLFQSRSTSTTLARKDKDDKALYSTIVGWDDDEYEYEYESLSDEPTYIEQERQPHIINNKNILVILLLQYITIAIVLFDFKLLQNILVKTELLQ